MQCSCGHELKCTTHTVNTDRGKKKWLDEPIEGDADIDQWDCPMCKRHMHEVSINGKVVKKFG